MTDPSPKPLASIRPAVFRLALVGSALLTLSACATRQPTEAEVLSVACSAGIAEACGYLARGVSVSGTPL